MKTRDPRFELPEDRTKARWGAALVILILALATMAALAWWLLDMPEPSDLLSSQRDTITTPAHFRAGADDRLWCAVSEDTGICSCINAAGERPVVERDECVRRARESRAH